MELIISSPTEDQFLKVINFNYDEIRNELINRLKKYEGLVYSENEIKEAKGDRANLNRFKTALDDKRKEIKRKVLEPFEVFENKVKDLLLLVDKPITEIDSQVKGYENKVKQDKRDSIESFYNLNIGDLAKLVPFDRVFIERWLNAGIKMAEIETAITERIATIRKDIAVIDTLNSEFSMHVKDYYLRTFDLSGALSEKARLEKVNADIKALASKPKEPEPIKSAPEVEAKIMQEVLEAPEIIQLDFRVWVTPTQLLKLKEFFLIQKIKHGRVE